MSIKKYTENLYASEVYRELERNAVKKGFFKPTDAQIKTASAKQDQIKEQTNRPISLVASDDLIQDVAKLAFAMRRKGYASYAEELEKNLILYKKAESALYNVDLDTSMDLVHFSHRDGDVTMVEGSGDLGDVETIESAAKKILSVVQKEPTGKQPNGKLASLANWILKNSQTSSENQTYTQSTPAPAQTSKISDVETTPAGDWKAALQGFNAARDVFGKDVAPINFEAGIRSRNQDVIKLYSVYSGVPIDTINNYFRIEDALRSVTSIEGTITGLRPDTAVDWLENVQRAAQWLGLKTDYFTGVSGVSQMDYWTGLGSRQWPGGRNDNSIYLESIPDSFGSNQQVAGQRYIGSDTNLQKLSNDLSQYFRALADQIWGRGNIKITEASQKFQAEITKMIETIRSVKINDADVIEDDDLDVGKGVAAINTAEKQINDTMKNYEATITNLKLVDPKSSDYLVSGKDALIKSLDDAKASVVKHDAVLGEKIENISGMFDEPIKYMQAVISSGANAKLREAAHINVRKLNAIKKALSRKNARWELVRPQLREADLLSAKSWGDAKEIIQKRYIDAAIRWAKNIVGNIGEK